MSNDYNAILDKLKFAETAAKWFAKHPEHNTFTIGKPTAGGFFACRWGFDGKSVLVFRIDDEEPALYGQIISHFDEE